MSFIINVKWWWSNVKASSPNKDLFLTMFFNGLKFVKALQSTIMPLIKSP